MDRGSIVAGRFRVEARHARGGVGEVHLAIDLMTGTKVALKVLRWPGDSVEARFAREAAVLSQLSHPGIVQYIANGRTPDGAAYLAMEWVDGESLAERLRRGPLTVDETLQLAARIADALSAAHQRRIVHRDLKPSNILLEGGDLERVKLVDFGLARPDAATLLGLTRPGELAGTPRYMAPEQTRDLHDVDARADVYSVGCVLFECLTGKPAFHGSHVFAVLAKILVEETPRVADAAPDVPAAVDALIARMMAKEPRERPADARELLGELRRVTGGPGGAPLAPPRSLGRDEQRVLGVILAAGLGDDDAGSHDSVETVPEDRQRTAHATLAAAVQAFGGRLDRLVGGHVVVTFTGSSSATDLAARVARAALAVAVHLPDKQVAVAIGRGVADERAPIGAVIDTAARLILAGDDSPDPTPSSDSAVVDPVPTRSTTPVRLDEITAGLLDSRFQIRLQRGRHLLVGYTEHEDVQRTLLGKPMPFVGRERELAQLIGIVEECRAEPVAQVVLVTGAAGAGKSRLRAELLARARAAGPVSVWIGLGDSMSAGAPLAMLSHMIRREAGILHGEASRLSRRRLRDRVAHRVDAAAQERVSVFLGELCGLPFSDDNRPDLRAARRDASTMGDQMRRAFEDLLAAECAAGPVVLVLEDLHWGDLPTVKFVDGALRGLANQPLAVLALARPEVTDLFPDLWTGRGLQIMPLKPLTDRASRKIIEGTLGGDVGDDLVRRITEQAGGNPFYLEELIRAASVGQDNPGTVLAMIGARLESLSAELRRLLRAASVLGETFWPDALPLLIDRDASWIESALAELIDSEWLVHRADSVAPGETAYGFRHALLREAAYAMLTDDDRRLGHRLAAEWLEKSGETDAMTIGEHHERGGQLGRAIGWYVRAAKQALDGTDLLAAVERARRGLRCAAEAAAHARPGTPAARTGTEEVGQLRAILAEAYTFTGDNREAEADGVAALELLPVGSAPWYTVASQVAIASGRLGHHDQVRELAEVLLEAELEAATAAAWVRAAAAAAQMLIWSGAYNPLVEELRAEIDHIVRLAGDTDPSLPAQVMMVDGFRAAARGDLGACRAHLSAAAEIFARLGDRRRACLARHDAGFAALELGAWELCESELRSALADAEQLGMTMLAATARQNLGLVLAERGVFEEGERLERESIAAFVSRGDLRLEASSHVYLATILMLAGDDAAAEDEARRAVDLEDRPSRTRSGSLGMLAEVLVRRGRAGEALVVAREAIDILEKLQGNVEGEVRIRLAGAEALHATGDVSGARAAIVAARERLQAMAACISDPALRESFLTSVRQNARTLALAREWT